MRVERGQQRTGDARAIRGPARRAHAQLLSTAVRPARCLRGGALALRPRLSPGLPFRGAGARFVEPVSQATATRCAEPWPIHHTIGSRGSDFRVLSNASRRPFWRRHGAPAKIRSNFRLVVAVAWQRHGAWIPDRTPGGLSQLGARLDPGELRGLDQRVDECRGPRASPTVPRN